MNFESDTHEERMRAIEKVLRQAEEVAQKIADERKQKRLPPISLVDTLLEMRKEREEDGDNN